MPKKKRTPPMDRKISIADLLQQREQGAASAPIEWQQVIVKLELLVSVPKKKLADTKFDVDYAVEESSTLGSFCDVFDGELEEVIRWSTSKPKPKPKDETNG